MGIIFEQIERAEQVGYISGNGSVYCPEHRPEESKRFAVVNIGEAVCRVCGKPAEEFAPETVSITVATEFFHGVKIF